MVTRIKAFVLASVVAALITGVLPSAALADVRVLDDNPVASSTNPGIIKLYDTVWRQGWGNDMLALFKIKIPQPAEGQPAILGGYYYTNRPVSPIATMTASLWPQSYYAPISNGTEWLLPIDLPGEVGNPGPLFSKTWTSPIALSQTYEGPFATFFQFVAPGMKDCASGWFMYGLDVTPPAQVTGLKASPSPGVSLSNGWIPERRVVLTWDDKTYDQLSGTGYFEAYLDGAPYQLAGAKPEDPGQRVFDMKEYYPGYGVPVNTKREMVIENLPAGQHTLQIRAVDRATNAGALSQPVTVKVSPVITSFGRTPRVFYPLIHDHYLDTSTITYRVSRRSVVTLTVRDAASGAVARQYTKTVNAGKTQKFVWDGKWASTKKAKAGKYTYQLTAKIASGNTVSTGLIMTEIRNYELKKLSGNRVKVIKR